MLAQKNVKSLIVPELTMDILKKELSHKSDPNELKYIFTEKELPLFKEYVPTLYHRIAKENNLEKNNSTKNLMNQFISEVINKSSTLDAGIVHGKRNRGSVESKIYNLERLIKIGNMLRIKTPEPITEEIKNNEDLDEILIHAKIKFTQLLKEIKYNEMPSITKHPLSKENEYDYIEDFKKDFGDNLVAIALYGSAAKETNPENISDYDNFLVVKDGSLPQIYPRIKGKKYVHRNGKHIGVNLVEERSFENYIRFNHDPNEYLNYCKVLHGKLNFPIVPEEEIKKRGIFYAILRTKTLKAACSWLDPKTLLDKKDLFDYFQKTLLFNLQSSLNTKELRYRRKDELKKELSKLDAKVYSFKQDEEYIMNTMYEASCNSTKILEKFLCELNNNINKPLEYNLTHA